jgi:hypothetical protein
VTDAVLIYVKIEFFFEMILSWTAMSETTETVFTEAANSNSKIKLQKDFIKYIVGINHTLYDLPHIETRNLGVEIMKRCQQNKNFCNIIHDMMIRRNTSARLSTYRDFTGKLSIEKMLHLLDEI